MTALIAGVALAMMLAVVPVSAAQAADLEPGETALSPQADSTHEVDWERYFGDTALDTMAEIVQASWDESHLVVIATSEGYWDALAASSLAGAWDAPVLFTASDSLSPQTKAEIERLGAKLAYVIGGVEAISSDVVQELAAMGMDPYRLAGDNAQGTAITIARELEYVQPQRPSTCVIATSAGYWDALSASPYCYAMQAPIFLTNADGELESPTIAAIEAGGFTRAIIAGGTQAVMSSVDDQLAAIGVSEVKRCWGQTAYDTAVDLATWEVSQGMEWDGVGIATGGGYWDALAGAALCGRVSSVLLLADDANSAAATSKLAEVKDAISFGMIFGGPFAVSDDVYDKLVQATASAKSAFASLNGWWQSIGSSGMYRYHFVDGTCYFYAGDLWDAEKFTHRGTGSIASMVHYGTGEIGAAPTEPCSVVTFSESGTTYVLYDSDPDTLNFMKPDGSGYSGSSSLGRNDSVPAALLALAAGVE